MSRTGHGSSAVRSNKRQFSRVIQVYFGGASAPNTCGQFKRSESLERRKERKEGQRGK